MKVLLINKFLYPKGGDAISALKTGSLLAAKSHDVIYWGMQHKLNPEYPYSDFFVSNVDFDAGMGFARKLGAAFRILYSFEARDKIRKLLKKVRPDIVHLNNFAHQISPSILSVFREYGIPAVMTMHDYKMVCASYTMFVNGNPCEMCGGGNYYWCAFNKCTKGSFFKSLVNTTEMYLHHKILHIYDPVGVFISPSIFLKDKIREMGFKGETVFLPNFIDAEEYIPEFGYQEKTVCYFGRLSKEKGLFTLLNALKGSGIKLKVIGEGPLEEKLKLKAGNEGLDNVEFHGYRSGEELKSEIKKSAAVVLPSEWFENNPRSVLEAFALGKPVIGSRIGGIPELVLNNETGLTFEAGNAVDLREKIGCLMGKPDRIIEMGKNARKLIEEKFSAEKHYLELMKIYETAGSKRN